MKLLGKVACVALCCLLAGSAIAAKKKKQFKFRSPDILVLGDSQLAFGSGPAFLDFFSDIKKSCNPNEFQAQSLKKLGDGSVGVIGVRSTSLHSWAARRSWCR